MTRMFWVGLVVAAQSLWAQTIPTFSGTSTTNGQTYVYTMVGNKPDAGGTVTIPTVVVPVSVKMASSGRVIEAEKAARELVKSPVFQPHVFGKETMQYGDALLHAEFANAASDWHTVLAQPVVTAAIQVDVPIADGYWLHSRRTHKSLAVVDLDYLQKQVFAALPSGAAGADKLVILVTRDVAFYSLSDATVCCSTGTHGVNGAQAFVVGSYFSAGAMARYTDVQGVTQQMGEWLTDPLRTNKFPRWLKPPVNLSCGGSGGSSAYLLQQPTDFLAAGANAAKVGRYHLENMALLFLVFAGDGRYV